MRIPRLHVDQPLREAGEICLPESAARHARSVLRLKPGAPMVLFDGRGENSVNVSPAELGTASRLLEPTLVAIVASLLAFVAVAVASFFPLAYRPPAWSPSVLAGLLGVLSELGGWSVVFTWRALADLVLGWALFLAILRAYSGRSTGRAPMPKTERCSVITTACRAPVAAPTIWIPATTASVVSS